MADLPSPPASTAELTWHWGLFIPLFGLSVLTIVAHLLLDQTLLQSYALVVSYMEGLEAGLLSALSIALSRDVVRHRRLFTEPEYLVVGSTMMTLGTAAFVGLLAFMPSSAPATPGPLSVLQATFPAWVVTGAVASLHQLCELTILRRLVSSFVPLITVAGFLIVSLFARWALGDRVVDPIDAVIPIAVFFLLVGTSWSVAQRLIEAQKTTELIPRTGHKIDSTSLRAIASYFLIALALYAVANGTRKVFLSGEGRGAVFALDFRAGDAAAFAVAGILIWLGMAWWNRRTIGTAFRWHGLLDLIFRWRGIAPMPAGSAWLILMSVCCISTAMIVQFFAFQVAASAVFVTQSIALVATPLLTVILGVEEKTDPGLWRTRGVGTQILPGVAVLLLMFWVVWILMAG